MTKHEVNAGKVEIEFSWVSNHRILAQLKQSQEFLESELNIFSSRFQCIYSSSVREVMLD